MTTNSRNIYIHGINGICSLGTDFDQIRRNFFDPNFVATTELYRNAAGKDTVIFPIFGEQFSDRNLCQDISFNCQVASQAIVPLQPKIQDLVSRYGRNRIGLVLGTSTSGISDFEHAIISNAKPAPVQWNQWIELGDFSQHLSRLLDISGPSMTISNACSSGALIFIEGSRLLKNGFCDAVIVGGCDTLSHMTINGFQSLGAAACDQTNPFSIDRRGMNLGEGAAFFILTREKADLRLAGFGETIDGYHISSPDPAGTFAEKAIRAALAAAELAPADIGYINLHGTGTIKNDEMEGALMTRIFENKPIMSSTKGLTGHTLGTAGALEVLLCCLILQNPDSSVPRHRMTGAGAFPELNLANGKDKMHGSYCMSNSFAFGGSNASIIIGRD